MKKFVTVIYFVVTAGLILAQTPKPLTLQESILGAYGSLVPERPKNFDWIPQSNSYIIEIENIYYKVEAKTGKQVKLFTVEEFNQMLKNNDIEETTKLPKLTIVNSQTATITVQNRLFQVNLKSGSLSKIGKLSDNAANLETEPSGLKTAFTEANNLYILLADGKTLQVTNEKNLDIEFGKAVHRYEFGIQKGTFWSPDGNKLAFYRNDQTMVTNYPILDISTIPATVKNIKYPMAGMKSEEVTIGVFDLTTQKTVYLNTGLPKDQYLTNVAWSPNNQKIYVAVLNRNQNHLMLNCYSATTGQFEKTLFEEKNDKYVQPLNPIVFLPHNAEKFLWQSERDGYNHLYLYNTNGIMEKQLTSGKNLVTQFLGFDPKGNQALIEVTTQNGLGRAIQMVHVTTGKITELTTQTGSYSAKFAQGNSYYLQSYSNVETPTTYEIVQLNGKPIRAITSGKNPLAAYQLGKTELVTVKNPQGVSLNARLIYPYNFDKNKRYPVLVYVYNGPNVQLVRNRWLADASLWMYYFANKGFLVFTIDGQGSENRGFEFEATIFKNLGKVEMMDQMAGINYLQTLPYVDPQRLAVHGWSYGGFMTTSLMLRQPGTFKVGVSGGGVMDWKFYEVMYTERYMDTPETNAEGYSQTSLLDKTKNLQGKLLMVHGTSDDTVVLQHLYDFTEQCIKNGVQIDYFPYVNHPHNVHGKDRIHLMQKVLDYIEIHL